MCIGFLVGFLVNGYLFKILKSSLGGTGELPGFNAWVIMFIDGVKVFVVFFVYLVLPILVALFVLSGSHFWALIFAKNLGSIGLSPLWFFVHDVTSVIWDGFLNLNFILSSVFGFVSEGSEVPFPLTAYLIITAYLILVIPIFLMGISNMAYYKGEFRAAFGLREILDDIVSIGVIKLIKWYIATGIIFLALDVIGGTIALSLIQVNPVKEINFGGIIVSLTIIPYSYMFLTRALALFYKPE